MPYMLFPDTTFQFCTDNLSTMLVAQSANKTPPTSGVAKLGHTGARALATRGCAPPVQALSVPNVNRELVHKSVEIELRSIAIWNNEVSYAPLISVYMYACML